MTFQEVRFVCDAGPFRRNEQYDTVDIDYSIGKLVATRPNNRIEHIFPIGLLEDPTYTLFVCNSVK